MPLITRSPGSASTISAATAASALDPIIAIRYLQPAFSPGSGNMANASFPTRSRGRAPRMAPRCSRFDAEARGLCGAPRPTIKSRPDLVAARRISAFRHRQRPQPLDVMLVRPIWDLGRVQHPASGARESNSFLRSGHHGDHAASEGTLREIRRGVWAPRPDLANGCPQSERRPVSATLVVWDDGANVRVVGQRRRAARGDQHIDRTALRKLRDERRRENDVAEKARLDNERSAQSVYLQDCEKRFLRNFHRAYLLHPLLAFLLLLEELALAGDVAAVALGEHVLP